MLSLVLKGSYKKQLKLAHKRGKNIGKLQVVVNLLQAEKSLPSSCRPHRLSGNWEGFWECHIEPDWLLIWSYEDDALVLEATGTHADIFR